MQENTVLNNISTHERNDRNRKQIFSSECAIYYVRYQKL